MYKIAIIGLGYVGLPLAIEFSKKFEVIGFDLSIPRVNELNQKIDSTLEFDFKKFTASNKIKFTNAPHNLEDCNIYIVTVPTPINEDKSPNLFPLESASKTIASYLKDGDIVIYESTVYPGATEEICVPILETYSNLQYNKDFFCGYSPERINPGDKEHTVTSIVKLVSGSTPETLEKIDYLYSQIITAGTYRVASIIIAEAAKVIENTQRDVNIALINELSLLFNKLEVDTLEVLEAAGTKWNFLPFRPGLVGGHCIGVDPYYLTHKAAQLNFDPEMILAGRRLNDNMGKIIAKNVIDLMNFKSIKVEGSKVLIMGLTFKEDCPDIRNTKVVDIINELKNYDIKIDVFDPWVDKTEVMNEYKIEPIDTLKKEFYDGIIVAVAHNEFKVLGINELRSFALKKHVIYDVKSIFQKNDVDGRL